MNLEKKPIINVYNFLEFSLNNKIIPKPLTTAPLNPNIQP